MDNGGSVLVDVMNLITRLGCISTLVATASLSEEFTISYMIYVEHFIEVPEASLGKMCKS